MNIIRRAAESDLPGIHQIQDIEFRSKVFLEVLLPLEEFCQTTAQRMAAGVEQYFVHEKDGELAGFIRLLKREEWEGLSWGKWLNTLLYSCFVVTFDFLKLEKLTFAIREDNARVIHLYKRFQFRKVSQEFMVYRWSFSDPIRTISIDHYEITRAEFDQRREAIKKTSMDVTFQI